MSSLVEKILAIGDALTVAQLEHAFGGALALAYYATPRTTQDIDVNVFVGVADQERIRACLEPLGVDRWPQKRVLERDAQYRARWDQTPIDVFLMTLPLHEAMRRERRRVPFGDREIWILAGEHLAICKALFNRSRDWVDLEEMSLTGGTDLAIVEAFLVDHLDEHDERISRLRALRT